MEVGEKYREICPFLGCISSHTFLEKTKGQRKKRNKKYEKKTTLTTEACTAVLPSISHENTFFPKFESIS